MTDIRKGFIKDSEGVYRRGRFYIKDGKILRESRLVPTGSLEEIRDNYITAQEAIRSVLSYSTTIGAPVRTTDVFINKVGNAFKPSDSYSSTDTVAIVTSSNNVLTVRVADVTPQYDDSLKLTDKADLPQEPKELKDFASNIKDKEFDNIEEVTKKELKESDKINESDADFNSMSVQDFIADGKFSFADKINFIANELKNSAKLDSYQDDNYNEYLSKVADILNKAANDIKLLKESENKPSEKKPLDKEKYFTLMNAIDDIVYSIGTNKQQLIDLKDDVNNEFDNYIKKNFPEN